jgi:hypothetical protein
MQKVSKSRSLVLKANILPLIIPMNIFVHSFAVPIFIANLLLSADHHIRCLDNQICFFAHRKAKIFA